MDCAACRVSPTPAARSQRPSRAMDARCFARRRRRLVAPAAASTPPRSRHLSVACCNRRRWLVKKRVSTARMQFPLCGRTWCSPATATRSLMCWPTRRGCRAHSCSCRQERFLRGGRGAALAARGNGAGSRAVVPPLISGGTARPSSSPCWLPPVPPRPVASVQGHMVVTAAVDNIVYDPFQLAGDPSCPPQVPCERRATPTQ